MLEAIITGLTLGFLLAISVGPIIFAIIKQSLTNGHKGGYAFVAGVSVSDIGLVLVCNLLSTLFQKAIENKVAIGITGSIFLIVIGVYTLFFKKVAFKDENHLTDKKFKKREIFGIFLSGFFMNILNPGVFIFWLAATAKIQTQALLQEHPLRYLITVFFVCLAFVLATDIAKVLLAGKIRAKLTPHNIHYINKISGLILVGFGAVLIYSLLTNGTVAH
ncbi:MAG: LysE family translocator [Chitinophagaceae bacterium]|jgi:threonine/homoserine/homoserine lactone efflux protein|nr:LysE family translocator [Chitinophagaceae bacterium]